MTTTIDFRTALREALDEELAADDRVIFFGEDVALAGGVFAVTPGLYEKYGRERVFDTPISELALAGAAFGAAISGLRPVVEIMFGDFLTLVMDSIVNQSTKYGRTFIKIAATAKSPSTRALLRDFKVGIAKFEKKWKAAVAALEKGQSKRKTKR